VARAQGHQAPVQAPRLARGGGVHGLVGGDRRDAAGKDLNVDDNRPPPPFQLGTIVHFKPLSENWRATPPHSDGPKRIVRRRWVGEACQSGYLIDVCDVAASAQRWSGYDASYFEVRK
jgi:hypothetical protein